MEKLGDRMKGYEQRETSRRFLPLVPVCARMDGRGFSAFTKSLASPYDARFSKIMIEVTRYLVEQTNAVVGYTQSDEISLIFFSDSPKAQIFFDAKVQKMTSILASMTTAKFNALLAQHIPEKAEQLPVFDARVWTVPTQEEAANVLLWRERDATRNSLSMAARAQYSHKNLMGKSSKDMHEMLHDVGINWNDYPSFFKRGTYIQRRKTIRQFTTEELKQLPPNHNAHANPELTIERTEVRELEMPPFGQVSNRTGVVFDGEDPLPYTS